MLHFAFEEVSLFDGLRAACAPTMMLLLGVALGRPEFAWAAIGAFWTCLAEAPGRSETRVASMLTFSILSTLAGGISAYSAAAGMMAGALSLFAFSTLAGFARIWGAACYQVAVLAATACVVMADRPLHNRHEAGIVLGTYFCGCLFATALSLIVWRLLCFTPSHCALRTTYLRLADLARDIARIAANETSSESEWVAHGAELRARTRTAIEAARSAFNGLPQLHTKRGREEAEKLRLAVADAEKAFASLTAVAHAHEGIAAQTIHSSRVARCLTAIASILRRTGLEIGQLAAVKWPSPRARLPGLSARLEAAFGNTLSLSFLSRQTAQPDPERQSIWPSLHLRFVTRASVCAADVRFALRLGMTTTIAFLTARALHLQFGYWATMAALLILQPSVGTTWPRSVERAIGTTVGALIAIVVGWGAHTPLAMSLLAFPMICLTMALRPTSYALYVVFLTPSFVFVANYASPANALIYTAARLGDNVIGSLIGAVAGYLLWPDRDSGHLQCALREAINANLTYLRLAFAQCLERDDEQCESARRFAGLASNEAERLFRLSSLETRRRDMAFACMSDVLSLLRRIAATAAKIQVSTEKPDHNRFALWVTSAHESVEAHLRAGSPQVQLPSCRALHPGPIEQVAIDQVLRLSAMLSRPNDSDSKGNAGEPQERSALLY
jgi:uncharacterized membrane protein YccC